MRKVFKSSDISTKYIKTLVYGVSGIGKTVFASTAPNPLYLDAEGGLLSVVDKDVDFIPINLWSDVKEIFMDIVAGKYPNETIVIDSLTEISKKSMDALVGGVSAGGTSAVSDKVIPNQHDWLMNIEETRRLVRSFRDIPKHIIMTCLARDEKNEVSGGITRKPSVSSKSLSDDILGYFDEVFYMEMDKDGNRWLLTQPYKTTQGYSVYAKDRSTKLSMFEEPDFTKLLSKIVKKKEVRK